MELTNCCGDVFGTVTLAAGTYDIEFIYNERFGGAYAGLWAARGNHVAFNDQFTLLGSGSPGPLHPDLGVAHARWPDEVQAWNTDPARAYRIVGYPLDMETGIRLVTNYRSAWWAWTAPVSGPVQVEATGAANPVYDLDAYSEAAGEEDEVDSESSFSGRSYTIVFTAVAGTTYYLRIDPANGRLDSVRFRIGPAPVPPANDNFAGAIHLGNAASVAASGNNAGATQETGEVDPEDEVYGKSVWFRWTAPYSGKFLVTFAGQPVEMACFVTTGNAPDSLTLISLNTQGRFILPAIAGITYNLMLDVLDPSSVIYTLSILPVPIVTSSSVSTVPGGRTFNLGWRSEPFTTYRIEQSTNLQTWSPVVTRFSSEGPATDIAITGIPLTTPKIFFRVLRE
jgi:hypothetical protein